MLSAVGQESALATVLADLDTALRQRLSSVGEPPLNTETEEDLARIADRLVRGI